MKTRSALVGLTLLLASVLAAVGSAGALQRAPAAAQRYEYRPFHDPNGTGKFYMGREIAQVMGHEGVEWLERPEREVEEQPTKLLDVLKLHAGDAVADVGAGSGYFTFRMLERVGPTGSVYAVDIQPEMLAIIRERARKLKAKNVRLVQGTIADPRLPKESVDLILLVDVYHEFSHPWEMTEKMVRALKPDGRLVLVEFRMEDPSVPIKLVHKMSEAQVRKEMSVHPLEWASTIGVLPRQHIIVFKKKAG
jgi:SAM-dependent methyltransferase